MRARLLERFPALAELPGERLDALIAQTPLVRAPAGSVLFDETQPCRGFPLVLEGCIRVAKAAPSGREIVLYRVDPGEGCIVSGGCILGHAQYPARGVAETDVVLLSLPSAAFRALILEAEPFRRFVFAMYGRRLADIMALVEEVAFRRLDERLALLLVRRGPVLDTTHQSLADELGSVREIVSRLLRDFASRGWVKLERERVTVLEPQPLVRASGQVRSPSSP